MLTPTRRPSRTFLAVEELEERRVPATLPSPLEQLLLERLNDIRANPAAYGQTINLNLNNVAASQPLAFDTRLIEAARNHSADMLAQNYSAHVNLAGVTPEGRVRATGFPLPANQTGLNESIAWHIPGPDIDRVLRDWIIDSFDAVNLGHRKHLLAMNNSDQLAGVGIAVGSNAKSDFTIDTASTSDRRPYLTGVVMKDLNNSGRYDVGEGVDAAQLRVLQNGTVVATVSTWSTGGYAVQLNAGTYTVEARNASGQLIAPVQTVTLGTLNVRATFFAADPTPPPPQPISEAVSVVDRDALGIWRHTQSSGWQQISTLDPLKVAVGADGVVYASFKTQGLQRWTVEGGWVKIAANKPANFVVGPQGTILGDYNSGGLWRYTQAAGWVKLSGNDPTSMQITADGTVIGAFVGINGIWRKIGGVGSWQKMTNWNTSGMALGADGILTVDFDSRGLWQYSTAGVWTRIATWDAESIAVGGDGAVVADFGTNGLWRWTAAAQWTRITTANAQGIAVNARGEVLADFGSVGLWRWFESSGWLKLLDADVAGLALG
jgi:uncharacterized protein YkwD